MHHILAVQACNGSGDFDAKPRHFAHRQRQILQPVIEGFAGKPFHHEIGLGAEIATSYKTRHMRAGKARQNHLLHFKADNGGRVFALGEDGGFEYEREIITRLSHFPQACHAAAMEACDDFKAVHNIAGCYAGAGHQRPSASRKARLSGKPAALILAMALSTS